MDYQMITDLFESPLVVGSAVGLGTVSLLGVGLAIYDLVKTSYRKNQFSRAAKLERQDPGSLEEFIRSNHKDLERMGYLFDE